MSHDRQSPEEKILNFEREVSRNQVESAKKMIAEKGFHDLKDAGGLTPLHIASSWGNKEVISALVKAGAGLEKQDAEGKTPLHHAAENAQTEAIYHLAKLGASSEARDRAGSTPIDLAYDAGIGSASEGVVAAALKEKAQLSGGKGSRDLLRGVLEGAAASAPSTIRASSSAQRLTTPPKEAGRGRG